MEDGIDRTYIVGLRNVYVMKVESRVACETGEIIRSSGQEIIGADNRVSFTEKCFA